MKKIKTVLAYSAFMLFLLCGTLPADDGMSPNETREGSNIEIEKISDFFNKNGIKVLHDSYGGNFYLYCDGSGNKYVTNSIDIIKKGYHPDITPKADLTEDLLLSESRSDSSIIMAESSDSDQVNDSEGFEVEESLKGIPDPLEPVNRVFFEFNDRLYFWFLKPVTKGYRAVVPEPMRIGVKNFFDNLAFPIRFVNCLFQGKIDGAAEEFRLFVVNSTIGVGGLLNLSETLGTRKYDEDLGQTLGRYGIKGGFFINWPFLGPSSLRDSIGSLGDSFLDPLNYMVPRTKYNITAKGIETMNDTSFSLGDYEDLKKAALDPYISIRDAYFQYRQGKIKE